MVGPDYIEPRDNSADYDQEIFLVLKKFGATFSRSGDMAMHFLAGDEVKSLRDMSETVIKASLAKGMPHSFEVGYDDCSINGRILSNDGPVRVRQGQRVILHVLNSSADEIRRLAMPGRSMETPFPITPRSRCFEPARQTAFPLPWR